MKHEIDTIIIPDVHGRTFWKEAVPFVEAGTHCIFLGDYVDPYDFDGISNLEGLDNMKEIVAFAHQYNDHVTMLLGNHDLSYFGEPWGLWTVYADRFCSDWADIISVLFNKNAELFSLCAFREVGGKPFLFSHAGIHPVWVNWCKFFDDVDKNDAKSLAVKVDELYHDSLHSDVRTELMEALSMVGVIRGGDYYAGSMVWADIREYDKTEKNYTQIFGHTAQRNPIDGKWGNPCLVGNNICVDCNHCFYLGFTKKHHSHKQARLQ